MTKETITLADVFAAELAKTEAFQIACESIQATMPQWEQTLTAFQGFASQLHEGVRAVAEAMAESSYSKIAVEIGRQNRWVTALDEAGWLPHDLLPYDAISEELKRDTPDVDALIFCYVTEQWPSLEKSLRERAASCGLDLGTVAAHDEALKAHQIGIYRACCRTIFPELERMLRIELALSGHLADMLKKFFDRAEKMTLPDIGAYGMMGMRMFDFLIEGCYDQVYEHDVAPSLPNRHAILHGLGSYESIKDSLNSLFVADLVFHLVAAIKRQAEEEAHVTKEPSMLTEDDIVKAVATHLERTGWTIKSIATVKQKGIDILAERDNRTLAVEAKGQGSGTEGSARFGKLFSSNQKRSHVATALLTAAQVMSRGQHQSAIALPADDGHLALIGGIMPALKKLGIWVFLVSADRTVKEI